MGLDLNHPLTQLVSVVEPRPNAVPNPNIRGWLLRKELVGGAVDCSLYKLYRSNNVLGDFVMVVFIFALMALVSVCGCKSSMEPTDFGPRTQCSLDGEDDSGTTIGGPTYYFGDEACILGSNGSLVVGVCGEDGLFDITEDCQEDGSLDGNCSESYRHTKVKASCGL